MQFSKMSNLGRSKAIQASLLALASMTAVAVGECRAESAYVAQVPGNVVTTMALGAAPHQSEAARPMTSARPITTLPPEASITGRGNNFASNLQIGVGNSTYQFQSGANNTSNTGIIGHYNNLTVLQAGNNLKSNVVLLNGAGLNVSVIQPRGSAPINVLIARLPGGGLLIKR